MTHLRPHRMWNNSALKQPTNPPCPFTHVENTPFVMLSLFQLQDNIYDPVKIRLISYTVLTVPALVHFPLSFIATGLSPGWISPVLPGCNPDFPSAIDNLSLLIYNFLTMLQTIKITSKRQITIPVEIFNYLNLKRGDRLIVDLEEDKIVMQGAQLLLDKIAGSLKPPRKYKNKSIDFIIRQAKREYFSAKK